MYYTVYRTTNKVNGKYYTGAHETSEIYDKYLGSGLLLKLAIAKYGIENFEKEVLHVFNTSEEMFKKEKETVVLNNEDSKSYNIAEGGSGGRVWGEINPMYGRLGKKHPFYGKNHSDETLKKMSEIKKGKNNPFYGKRHTEETKQNIKKSMEGNKHRLGIKHSEKTKLKISKAMRGNLNAKET